MKVPIYMLWRYTERSYRYCSTTNRPPPSQSSQGYGTEAGLPCVTACSWPKSELGMRLDMR